MRIFCVGYTYPMAQGLFGISSDYSREHQSLDARFVRNKESTFFFETTSNAMSPYFLKGDVLIVDRSVECTHNKIVVCSVNGELYCRRLITQSGAFLLRSEHRDFKDIFLPEEVEVIFFGVVIAVGRDVE